MSHTVEDVVERARADDIRLVRFQYCDPAGVIRAKTVHVARLAARMREGIGLTRAQNTVNMLDLLTPRVEGMEPVRRDPDLAHPDTGASCVGASTAGMLSANWATRTRLGCCPRSYLKRVIDQAAEAGVMVLGLVRERVLPVRGT